MQGINPNFISVLLFADGPAYTSGLLLHVYFCIDTRGRTTHNPLTPPRDSGVGDCASPRKARHGQAKHVHSSSPAAGSAGAFLSGCKPTKRVRIDANTHFCSNRG